MRWTLQPADRCARAAVSVLLEDGLQPVERLLELALVPDATGRNGVDEAVRRQRRRGLGRDLELRGVALGRERPRGPRLIAVELPAPAGRDDLVRRLDVDERHVAP